MNQDQANQFAQQLPAASHSSHTSHSSHSSSSSGRHVPHHINPEHFADMNHRPHRPDLDVNTAQHLAHQEQGFIAAAHRADRAMDARIESAHRASEVHFERTGRKLLVTREGLEKGHSLMELSKWESSGRPGTRKSHGSGESSA